MEKDSADLGNIFVIVPRQIVECRMRYFYVCTFSQFLGISYGLCSNGSLLTTLEFAALNLFQLVWGAFG